MPFAYNRANISSASLSSVKIRESGQTEFLELPTFKEGKVTEHGLIILDKFKREKVHAVELEASCKVIACNDLTNWIELLDDIGTLDFDFQLTSSAGTTWDTSLLTPALGGVKWRLASDSDMDDAMYTEMILTRKYKKSEMDTIHGTPTASVPDVGTVDGIITVTDAAISSAGIYKIEMGDGAFTDAFEALRKTKFEAELITAPEMLGRNKGFAIKILVEAESFQMSSAEALLLDTLAGQQNDWKVTFVNGRIATLTEQLGFQFDSMIEGDGEDVSYVKLMGSGYIDPSVWDAIWT